MEGISESSEVIFIHRELCKQTRSLSYEVNCGFYAGPRV